MPPRGRERGVAPRLTDLSPISWPSADSRRFSWPRRYLKDREAADEAAAKLERLENTPEGKSSGLLGGASNKSRELKKQREKSDGAAARVTRKSPRPCPHTAAVLALPPPRHAHAPGLMRFRLPVHRAGCAARAAETKARLSDVEGQCAEKQSKLYQQVIILLPCMHARMLRHVLSSG